MKTLTYLESPEQLESILVAKVDEVILGPKELSRFGTLSLQEVSLLAGKLKQHGIRSVLEWDILMTENVFQTVLEKMKMLDLSQFDAIRVQDPGALEWVLQNGQLPIQLNLETGNHNLEALMGWKELVGERLERMILSLELTKEKLAEYVPRLGVDCELQALGKILLFYTPRALVSPLYESREGPLEVVGHSEESPHKGFTIIENRHGTFMFNPSEQCLVEHLDEIAECGITHVRFDLRFGRPQNLLIDLVDLNRDFSRQKALGIKAKWPVRVIKGFFKTNKTNTLFKKLKNQRTQRRDTGYLGEVVDVIKKEHVGIFLKSDDEDLKPGDSIRYETPDGRVKTVTIERMTNALKVEIALATKDQVVFVPHTSGVSIKTAVYKERSAKKNGV